MTARLTLEHLSPNKKKRFNVVGKTVAVVVVHKKLPWSAVAVVVVAAAWAEHTLQTVVVEACTFAAAVVDDTFSA
jgi:hypothetical protein